MGLLFVIALIGSAASNSRDPVSMYIRRGQYRMAVQNIFRRLEGSPDDPELYSMLGLAWSRSGYMADAVGAFQLCGGGEHYEDEGLEAHANALRELGDPEAASELRRQKLLDPNLSEGRMVRVYIGLVDDARAAGDLDGALHWVEEAEAVYPRAPIVQAAVADIMMDIGDYEAADVALWESAQLGATRRGIISQARRSLSLGNYLSAETYLEDARALNSPNNALAALRAEVQRLQGFPEDAAEILNRSRWELTEDPMILAIRIRVAVDLGDIEAAKVEADRARAIYSENKDVQYSLEYLAAAL